MVLLAQLKILGATTRSYVDNASTFCFANNIPEDNTMGLGGAFFYVTDQLLQVSVTTGFLIGF